ncbi:MULTISPECIES: 2,3-diaminopropionate biosynthesis protein SbnB [Bacillus]|uniref:2,3-diaminopropionate biosynthesis protein SbnB n=1 Tax=Bacillus cereus HuA3-9 TaxID=1053205 RepID=R8CX59_BACCE|nr:MULTISPECIES: 2,3-diaminopropionate biosynthesis protein SbnB [Bacillus cereus group]NIE92202.1 2,3-diaminopropionate biosynthesis protein SbnB [Bacillus sp. Ab-1751]EOO16142.1 2,3-diaminopropionate biosynthesis protein SbnB [Bacillus cereus HuA3-9]MCU5332257.1 2,3-diaminopropionate biosynthesis protein SbnB [Bacillus wiedmannii]PEV20666.1 2,3-diaminopropionate biosynthesis protein SbnB [Bacillus thuringiensis]PEX65839.1 2,3-diaminopropionate biosynthesis protein SbnB [Bacillus cereus]
MLLETKPELLYLNKQDIIDLGGYQSDIYVKAIKQALTLHSEKNFSQPLKPYLKTNKKGEHIADRIIAMPAYLGDPSISGVKWIGSKFDNPIKKNMERASALIILNDPKTNFPIAILEGSVISSMRTAAVTAVAVQYLAKKEFKNVSIIGCGLISKMHIISLLEQFTYISQINLFDLDNKKAKALAQEMKERFCNVDFKVQDSAKDAVEKAEVLVTCTVADAPYIKAEWIQKGTFVSNISIMDIEKEAFLIADKVIVDDWDQANREKKVINQLVLEGKFSKEMLHAELGDIITGKKLGRVADEEIIILNPMGMAIEDIACAHAIYEKAIQCNAGKTLSLY